MSSRHFLCAGLLLFVPAIRPAQQTNPAEKPPVLHSKAYRFEDLNPNSGGNFKMYSIFDGITTRGERLEMHESELRPGEKPNPAHPHHNEEIIVILAGTLDVTIGAITTRMGPGSAGYAESEDKIGIALIGAVPAKYIVFSVGDR